MSINVKKPKSIQILKFFKGRFVCLIVIQKIAELAYLKAESRGFAPGHELEDWLEAEGQFLL
jgi:hypothetical protein